LTVKATVNREQLVGDVSTWVEQARADEGTHFGGRPMIRQFVLGRDVEIGTATKPQKVTGHEFVERMGRRNALVGWNDGDRLMVRLLVAGGTVADAAGDTAAQSGAKETESATMAGLANVGLDTRVASDDRLKVVEAAVTRATDPDVIAALSALASEIVVQQKR